MGGSNDGGAFFSSVRSWRPKLAVAETPSFISNLAKRKRWEFHISYRHHIVGYLTKQANGAKYWYGFMSFP